MSTAVRYRVVHVTEYQYSEAIASARHLAHLSPRTTPWQRVAHHRLAIDPNPVEYAEDFDYFGNPIVRFAMGAAHQRLVVVAESELSVQPRAAEWSSRLDWSQARPASANASLEVQQFTLASPCVPLLPEATAFARESLRPGRPVIEGLLHLSRRIQQSFVYDPQATSVSASVDDLLRSGRGVCQDFTHFMLSGLRGLGLAACYMSGYVAPLGEAGANQGAGASHAWVAVCVPGCGWVGCDPTNGKLADDEFITLAWGRDFGDVTPLRGVILARGPQQLRVSVQVERLLPGREA